MLKEKEVIAQLQELVKSLESLLEQTQKIQGTPIYKAEPSTEKPCISVDITDTLTGHAQTLVSQLESVVLRYARS